MNVQPTRRAVFVASQKGGPGKSTTARALLDYYRTHAIGCAAYDADGRVGQLLQYYGERGADGELLREQNPSTGVG